MFARSLEHEARPRQRPPFRRNLDGQHATEVFPRERTPAGVAHGTLEDDTTTLFAAPRPQLNQVIRHPDRVQIVLHHQHSVTAVPKPAQEREQPVHIPRVQPDRRLVEDVQRVHQPGAQRIGERDTLRLAAGERARGPIERDVAQAHVGQEVDAIPGLAQHVGRDLLFEWGQ